MTACKKEDVKKEKATNLNLKLLKYNITDNGFMGDLNVNVNDGKLLFVIYEYSNSSKMQLTKNYTERQGCFNCDGDGDECEIDHVRGIVWVRKGADPKK